MRQDNKCGVMKKPTPRPDLNHRPPGYRLGATLGGQTWRGQLRGEFYQYYYQLYQLGTRGCTQSSVK